jgi:hypothetical protein
MRVSNFDKEMAANEELRKKYPLGVARILRRVFTTCYCNLTPWVMIEEAEVGDTINRPDYPNWSRPIGKPMTDKRLEERGWCTLKKGKEFVGEQESKRLNVLDPLMDFINFSCGNPRTEIGKAVLLSNLTQKYVVFLAKAFDDARMLEKYSLMSSAIMLDDNTEIIKAVRRYLYDLVEEIVDGEYINLVSSTKYEKTLTANSNNNSFCEEMRSCSADRSGNLSECMKENEKDLAFEALLNLISKAKLRPSDFEEYEDPEIRSFRRVLKSLPNYLRAGRPCPVLR